MKEEVNARQLIIGINILVLGVIFYYLFRSAHQPYFFKFFSSNIYLKDSLSFFFPIIGNSLPTFIHAFAFIVITASLVANQKREYLYVTLAWLTINMLFEIGQGFGTFMSQIIPEWFSDYIFLENTKNYFLHGRFDYFDLLSIALGSLGAYILLVKTKNEKGGANEK